MFNDAEFASSVPPGTGREMAKLPYDVARKELYRAEELFDRFDPGDPSTLELCLDTRIARHVEATGNARPAGFELHMRSMHDAHVRTALYRMLNWYEEKRVVGIMGGHALLRTDAYYRRVVEVAKTLTESGYMLLSGGGPGAMEATHAGAFLAGRSAADLEGAMEILSVAPSLKDAEWLSAAFRMMRAYPQTQGHVSISVPTWRFASEPPTPLATYIAKMFENSLREEILLSEAYGGVIFMPGGAGTLQEIFQNAVMNHYVTLGYPRPMVFVGWEFWTETIPVYPLVERLLRSGRFRNLQISLVETADEIVAALSRR